VESCLILKYNSFLKNLKGPEIRTGLLDGTNSVQLKKDDIYCVVTFSSIISIEAILNGYPVITLGPNAASYLSESKIENIDNPYFPDDDKIKEHLLYLSACQFEKEDFLSGYALKTVNELQHDQKYLDFKL
jgi:hypothetical protein